MPHNTKLAFRLFKIGSEEEPTNRAVLKYNFFKSYTNICFSTL